MSFFRKPNPRSNWKRPKPKIYDCNSRDLENFYTSSYSEYLDTKQDIRAREQERQNRGDAETLTRRFEQRRALSLVYGEDDAPRQHRFVPSRQISNEGSTTTEHSHLRSSLSNSFEEASGRDGRSSTSSTRNVSYNTSLNAEDSNKEMASIETRLERLRKLREELGLPSEAGSSSNAASSSTLTSSSKYTTESRNSPSETRGRESSRIAQQVSAARSDSRSRASEAETSAYSSRAERASARNGLDDTTTSSYSRSSRAGGDTNGLSSNSVYESSALSSTRTRKRVEKPSLEGIDMNFDDDALMIEMRRKIPSSQEILEKIRSMDID